MCFPGRWLDPWVKRCGWRVGGVETQVKGWGLLYLGSRNQENI
jgi:hypothetical protein